MKEKDKFTFEEFEAIFSHSWDSSIATANFDFQNGTSEKLKQFINNKAVLDKKTSELRDSILQDIEEHISNEVK